MPAHLEEDLPILRARGGEETRGLPVTRIGTRAAGKGSLNDAATTHRSSELRPDGREQDRPDVPDIDLPLRIVLGR